MRLLRTRWHRQRFGDEKQIVHVNETPNKIASIFLVFLIADDDNNFREICNVRYVAI